MMKKVMMQHSKIHSFICELSLALHFHTSDNPRCQKEPRTKVGLPVFNGCT